MSDGDVRNEAKMFGNVTTAPGPRKTQLFGIAELIVAPHAPLRSSLI